MSTPHIEPRHRQTLRALVDAFVPRLETSVDGRRLALPSGGEAGVDVELARIIVEYLPTYQRKEYLQLLSALDNPMINLILTGRPRRFSRLTQAEREKYLLGWGGSRLLVKRRGFQAAKRLALFLYYARSYREGPNAAWGAFGYAPPPNVEHEAATDPSAGLGPLVPDEDLDLTTDVCIVGSGAGGATIAARLATAGHRVIILEAGGWNTSANFPSVEADGFERLYEGHGIVTTEDSAIAVLAGATAGGSTTVNWMTCLRPLPIARAEWETEHGLTGIVSSEFDRMLDFVSERVGVSTDESQVNPSNEVLRRGCHRLGYTLGSDYEIIPRNARGCRKRCGPCSFGCRYNAKQSTLVTFLPDAMIHGAVLICDARADRIEIQSGRAVGVRATYRSGTMSHNLAVRAKAVVVAGNAIQTPTLLLRSGIRFSGVGAGLRLDPTTAVVGEFDHPIRTWEGPMQTIAVRKFQSTDEGDHGPWIEAAPAHPGLAALALPWEGGAAHQAGMLRLERAAASIILVRDVAEGRVWVDSHGDPVLTYRLDRRDRANLLRGILETARIHRAAGARRILTLHTREISVGDGRAEISDRAFEDFLARVAGAGVRENAIGLFSAHPMGSARAGHDARRSAALPTGECHEVENLWIGDGSLLPTAPGVNPMISIMAMACRTAGFIHQRLK